MDTVIVYPFVSGPFSLQLLTAASSPLFHVVLLLQLLQIHNTLDFCVLQASCIDRSTARSVGGTLHFCCHQRTPHRDFVPSNICRKTYSICTFSSPTIDNTLIYPNELGLGIRGNIRHPFPPVRPKSSFSTHLHHLPLHSSRFLQAKPPVCVSPSSPYTTPPTHV